MISVDRNGSVWVTDVGRHQALQFTPAGKLIRAVGKDMRPGHDKDTLCKPTQVGGMLRGWLRLEPSFLHSHAHHPPSTAHLPTHTTPHRLRR
jgi:hypothetical protein